MIKKLYLPLVALLVLALSSCGKMGELSSDYFTTNPEVLEAIGGKVPVTINGKFPEKYFKKPIRHHFTLFRLQIIILFVIFSLFQLNNRRKKLC